MKKTKTQKGITLVALIITIVVLLILALVTINAVRGDGIIGKAQQAKDEYEKGADEEKTTLGGYLANLEENAPGGSSSDNGQDNNEDEIQDGEQEKPDNTEQEDENIFKENNTINGEAYSSTNPIIPAGFKPVDTDTSNWGNGTNLPEVDNGLVISDGNNEFVWVPVTKTIEPYGLGTRNVREPDVVTGINPSKTVNSASGTRYDTVEANLTLAGCTRDFNGDNAVNAYDFKIQLTNEFEEMAASVKKYGGFYVGRYQTSINNRMVQSVKNVNAATTETYSGNTWYGLYAIQKTYNTSSVKSTMIWGSQYDAMMSWMGDVAGTKIGDSRNTSRRTGNVEADKIKNVYDLYGCLREWTLEAGTYGDARASRGGDWLNEYAPNERDGRSPTVDESDYGSRFTLYIL